MQRSIGGRAHTRRIAQPHIVGIGVEVKVDLPSHHLGVAAECDLAAAGAGRETLDRDLVLAEQQCPVNFAECAGQIAVSNGPVLYLEFAFDQRRIHGAAYGSVASDDS